MLEKLIRDQIPELAAAEGRVLATRTARDEELDRLFGLKLVEETAEVIEALSDFGHQELIDEIADLQTVIDDLAARKGITRAEIEHRIAAKRESRGGFKTGLVLQTPLLSHRRLHVGGTSTLVDAICKELQACVEARFAVAFVMRSGLDLLEGPIRAALLRGVNLKFLTTDYLGVTEPEALERMLKWPGQCDVRVYSHERRSFHPKAYFFKRPNGSGRAFIGSANMSRMGLREGIEWTWSVLDIDAGQPLSEIGTRFDELFNCVESNALTHDWIAAYQVRRPAHTDLLWGKSHIDQLESLALEPRPVQTLALAELDRLRTDGQTKALVVAATGLGKTYLAAFDAAGANKVLFIAHREEMLRQAAAAFQRVYPNRSCGYVMQGHSAFDCDCVFASIQTLSLPENLAKPELARFDYVIIDEFHHAAAKSYQSTLQALRPNFLLGLTATPFRTDNRDLLQLCDGNLAYQIGLFEAIGFGWLAPFHYYGVADVVTYSEDLLTTRKTYDTDKLTIQFNTTERARLVIEKFRQHRHHAALGFCVSIDHADFMAAQFVQAGIPAASVHSGPNSEDRIDAVRRLSAGELQILFTVDMFNEGVDIPVVDLALFLRPTESMVVFIQQLGRGLRLHPKKEYLTVLDFIGNYRNAHYKLPLLVGQDLAQDPDPAKALKALRRWLEDGVRPDSVPEGITIEIEPVALTTLQQSIGSATPLRKLILSDLEQLADRMSRPPTLTEWQQMGQYSLSTARTALAVDRWHLILQVAGLLSSDAQWLESHVGDFLREIEKSSMTKSFKMVTLLAMCAHGKFQRAIHIDELVVFFRAYFSEERHRSDITGTAVEDVEVVSREIWQKYILDNPVNAWIGGNTNRASSFFSWNGKTSEFCYIGPPLAQKANGESLFGEGIRDRAAAKLLSYWGRPGPGKFVFPVIPTGTSDDADSVESAERSLCIMFGSGEARNGLPEGWHAIRINGEFYYGKFAKVALNVIKNKPSDDRSIPNELTQQLRRLLLPGNDLAKLPPRPRVRLVKSPTAAIWDVLLA